MIIPVELYHLEEIIAIENFAFNKPWTKNQFKNDILSYTDSENWVYIMDELVTGYIFGWIIHDEFHLNNIAVNKQFQGKGLGGKLLAEVIHYVKAKNGKLVFLEVMHDNESAIRLYEQNGFISVGKRKDYTKGKHAILYTLELNNG